MADRHYELTQFIVESWPGFPGVGVGASEGGNQVEVKGSDMGPSIFEAVTPIYTHPTREGLEPRQFQVCVKPNGMRIVASYISSRIQWRR
jgi:hypothetical protein